MDSLTGGPSSNAMASPLPLSPNQLYLATGSFGLGSGLSESGSQSDLGMGGIGGMDAVAFSAVAAANNAVLASQRRVKAVLPASNSNLSPPASASVPTASVSRVEAGAGNAPSIVSCATSRHSILSKEGSKASSREGRHESRRKTGFSSTVSVASSHPSAASGLESGAGGGSGGSGVDADRLSAGSGSKHSGSAGSGSNGSGSAGTDTSRGSRTSIMWQSRLRAFTRGGSASLGPVLQRLRATLLVTVVCGNVARLLHILLQQLNVTQSI